MHAKHGCRSVSHYNSIFSIDVTKRFVVRQVPGRGVPLEASQRGPKFRVQTHWTRGSQHISHHSPSRRQRSRCLRNRARPFRNRRLHHDRRHAQTRLEFSVSHEFLRWRSSRSHGAYHLERHSRTPGAAPATEIPHGLEFTEMGDTHLTNLKRILDTRAFGINNSH